MKKLNRYLNTIFFVLIFINIFSLCLSVTVEFANRSSCISSSTTNNYIRFRNSIYGWNNLSIVSSTGDSYDLKNYSSGSVLNFGSIPNDDSCASYNTRQNLSGTVDSLAWYRGGMYITAATVFVNPFPVCKDIDASNTIYTITLSSDLYVGPDTKIGSIMVRGKNSANSLTTTQEIIMMGDVQLKGSGHGWTFVDDTVIDGCGNSFNFNGEVMNTSLSWAGSGPNTVTHGEIAFKNIVLKNFFGLGTYHNGNASYDYVRYDFENTVFELQANSDFRGGGEIYPNLISFSGDIIFKGNGYTISFDEPISVEKNATLRFDKGTTVKFAHGASVTMTDSTSCIYFDGCNILLDSSLTSTVVLSNGLVCFDNKVNLNSGGGLNMLSVSTTSTVRVLAGARLVVGNNAHLSIS